MARLNNYKLFYFIQAFLKYFPFKSGIYLRRLFYRLFFNSFGKGVIIHDNVLIKFPTEISLGNFVHIEQNAILVGGGGIENWK
jgi:hypothetical protein